MLPTSNGHRRQYEALDEENFTAAFTTPNAVAVDKDYTDSYNCGHTEGCMMQLVTSAAQSLAYSRVIIKPSRISLHS